MSDDPTQPGYTGEMLYDPDEHDYFEDHPGDLVLIAAWLVLMPAILLCSPFVLGWRGLRALGQLVRWR